MVIYLSIYYYIVMSDSKLVKIIGLKLKFERYKRKLSQEKLACMTGLTVNSISSIERGVANPTIETIESLANALKIPVEELVNPKKIDL